MNSRSKGCRGERECRDGARHYGYMKAYRTQQYCGTAGNSDVTIPELPWLHIECKRVEKGNIYDWMEQSRRDAGHKTPIVWHKRNHREPLIIMYEDDWYSLISKIDWKEPEEKPRDYESLRDEGRSDDHGESYAERNV